LIKSYTVFKLCFKNCFLYFKIEVSCQLSIQLLKEVNCVVKLSKVVLLASNGKLCFEENIHENYSPLSIIQDVRRTLLLYSFRVGNYPFICYGYVKSQMGQNRVML
jgi:hypothetical protein